MTAKTSVSHPPGSGQAGPAPIALRQRLVVLADEALAMLIAPRETLYAVQTSRDLLKLFWIVSASHPGLDRRDVYRKVVVARTGASAQDAESVLVRAEQSFATWPSERPLTFSDVVHYLAVSEFLASNSRIGTRTNMGRVVAGRISGDL